jgi:hypothetical protein
MAFTEAQRVKIRAYLGYPDVYRQYNPRLESAFDVIGGRSDTQTYVENLLTKLDALDLSLTNLLALAGLRRAEEVEWYQAMSANGNSAPMEAACAQGRRLVGRLSTAFGVPVYSDYFGKGGYPGDAYMGPGMQQSGGIVPLG